MDSIKPFIVFLMSVASQPAVATGALSMEEAEKKGLVKLLIKSKGGYTGEVISIRITSRSSDDLLLKLEAGRRLDSQTQSEQDILVTNAEDFVLSRGSEKTLTVSGMCCQAGNQAPSANSIYTIGSMADSALVNLASYIDKNNYQFDYTAQQAVWCVSDGRSPGSIMGDDKKIREGFRKYVSTLTGRPVPAYDISYQEGNDGSAMGHATRIDGVFSYTLNENCHATLAIYDRNGGLVQLLFRDLSHQKGPHKLYYTFRVQKLPQGTYYARMEAGDNQVREMRIEF